MKKASSKEKGLETIKEDSVDSLKKSLQEAKGKVDKFQKNLLKKFDKYVLGIALLPPKKEDKGKVDIFVLFDDADSKKMNKVELRDKFLTF